MTCLKIISITLLLITTIWGGCAIAFADSNGGNLEFALAILFAMLGFLTLIGIFFYRWRKVLVSIYLVAFACIVIRWLAISPSNDRPWKTEASKLAHANFTGDLITIYNIRNFDYHSEFDYQPDYYDKTFDIKDLQGVDLFSIYWMGPAIAHTIISFDFGAGNHLAISIEARKELNESYSTIKGFFRQYELIYFVADERDVIRLRTNYRRNPPEQVYRYRLQGRPENAKNLFLAYMRKINDLNHRPEFYNTLLDNCTTDIWLLNRINPGHLPFSWKVLLSGYLPEYLYEQQKIDTQFSFAELQKKGYINQRAQAADQSSDFSTRIRAENSVQSR